MRAGKETLAKVNELRAMMYKCNVTDKNLFNETMTLIRLVKLAQAHCRIQERACERELLSTEIKKEANIEREVLELAKSLDLQAIFTGDPRGYTVKLLSAKNPEFFNTWGGRENGYGI